MHYFLIEAVPAPENETASDVDGAYINCWINFQIEDGAELLALHFIRQEGWLPGKIEERRWVDSACYEEDSEGLTYYREAEADGACFVFNSWDDDMEDA